MGEIIKQEVTLGILGNKMDNLTDKFDVHAALDRDYKEKIEKRMRIVEDKMIKFESDLSAKQRVSTAISIILGSIAAYLGIRF